MQIGGTLVTAVVRIAVLAATLALVYFFIIRPVLDTTEKGLESASNWSNGLNGQVQTSIDEATGSFSTSNGGQQRKIKRLQREIRQVPPGKMSRLNPCIVRAGADINRMIRCAERLQ